MHLAEGGLRHLLSPSATMPQSWALYRCLTDIEALLLVHTRIHQPASIDPHPGCLPP